MHSVSLVWALLLFTNIFFQDRVTAPVGSAMAARPASPAVVPGDFDFAGAVLRISVDSMSEHQVCSVTTVNNGAWIAVSGDRAAMVVTMKNRSVDYDRPAFLRIGEAPPFRLGVPRRPHFMAIPFSKSADVVRALYTQQRVRLRFTEWPDGSMFDEELEPGDFAAAYDRGVELCGWPRLGVAAVHPAVVSSPLSPEESEASAAFALEAKDAEAAQFRAFASSVEHELRQNWVDLIFPAWSRTPGVSAHCVVAFSLSQDGAVKDVHLSSGSGDPSVDNLAQRAVLALDSSRVQFPSGHASPIAFRAVFDWASSSVKIAQ